MSMNAAAAVVEKPVTVLVVDDHRTFTDLVVLALEDAPDLHCVGAAHDAAQARALAAQMSPDVVLMDVQLRDEDGLDLAAELLAEQPDLRVVVLTAFGDNVGLVHRAASAGACALLPKDGSLPELLEQLRHARQGGLIVQSALLKQLFTQHAPAPAKKTPFAALTPREQHVLQLLAEGRDVRRISGELKISINTCRGYVKTLLGKLGAHSQLEAVVIAGMHGLVDDPRAG